MLGTLCTLITALTCVSGVTVVTQKPPVVAVTKGETVTMDCNLGTVTNERAWWYKQTPGGVPQFVLRFRHDWSSVRYGSGFSSPKFTSTHQSTSDYRLIINNVEEGDSAVYYCQTWDTSASVSGVAVVTQEPPVVTVRKGETANMDCDVSTDDGSRWYKQSPGGAFQFVLRNHHSYSSPTYGSGFSSPRFTSSHLSGTKYRLTISNVEEGDSAVYHCETWDNSAKENVSQ